MCRRVASRHVAPRNENYGSAAVTRRRTRFYVVVVVIAAVVYNVPRFFEHQASTLASIVVVHAFCTNSDMHFTMTDDATRCVLPVLWTTSCHDNQFKRTPVGIKGAPATAKLLLVCVKTGSEVWYIRLPCL